MRVAEAFETLSDSERRRTYDWELRREEGGGGGREAPSGGASFASQQRRREAAAAFMDPFAVFSAFFGGGGAEDLFSAHRASFPSPHADFFAPPPFFGSFAGATTAPQAVHPWDAQRQAHQQQQHPAARGSISTSTSTSTVVVNGVRTTRTTRIVRHADGRVETQTSESTDEVPGYATGWGLLGAPPSAGRRGAGGWPTQAAAPGDMRGFFGRGGGFF